MAVRADRAQLLAAAQRAIADIGPDATMDQIAAEAGVTKPILYRTIGDKAALVDSLSDLLVERIGQAVDAAIVNSTDPELAFAASIRAHLEAVDADRNLYLFVNGTGQRSAPLRARIDRAAAPLVEVFSNSQKLPNTDPSATVWGHAVVGALQTVTLMWLEGEGEPRRAIDDTAADVAALFWPGVSVILGVGNGTTS